MSIKPTNLTHTAKVRPSWSVDIDSSCVASVAVSSDGAITIGDGDVDDYSEGVTLSPEVVEALLPVLADAVNAAIPLWSTRSDKNT